jgi:hypothetical protein
MYRLEYLFFLFFVLVEVVACKKEKLNHDSRRNGKKYKYIDTTKTANKQRADASFIYLSIFVGSHYFVFDFLLVLLRHRTLW